MASEDSDRSRARTRDRTRIVLVVCCLLAVGLAGVLVPSLTGGVVDSPAESLVPGDAIQSQAAENVGSLSQAGLGDINTNRLGQSGGGFGALNPGQSTDIGGSTGASAALDSQSTSTHFTVRSSSPAYWRTGAYDTYTGSGWEQTGDTSSFDGSVSGDGIDGPRVDYRVELNRSATALPTVWRPSSVDGVSDLRLTDQRSLRASTSLGPGTTFSGTSHKPPQDPQVLRTSGTAYPTEIEERYTALPDDTPSRVGLFTDDLTADASTPYEKAVAIEQWLEANKEYSLDASRTSDQMTDTFLFEMDAGYCEYFATAMTTMLRSQDIPARYVVGYSTGQQVGEDTYQVRGMNAHAWVEVYFEDVGWVKFDPTPGSARLQQEQQSLQEQEPDANYSHSEQGSPGEQFSPENNGTDTDDGSDDSTSGDPVNETNPTGETESGYQVTLNRTAVPGVPVTVTVTQSGQLQSGVTVLFNDDPIGQTDDDGSVVGTVPYTDELRVSVRNESSGRLAPPGDLPDGTDERVYSVDAPPDSVGPPVAANLTVPVDTNTSVAVTGETVPNANVTVTATVGGVPLRNASVLLAGERVATTDRAGRATITLPGEGGNVTVAVERGSVRGTRNLTLPTLSLQVTPTAPLALPYTDAVVTVTASGDPVANAPVRIDGEQVATTDINGTATVTLPMAEAATISATGAGVTREATVGGLYTNLGLVALSVVLVVGGVFGLAYRRGYTPRDLLALTVRLPSLVARYSQWLLVTVATRWDDAVAALLARARTTLGYIRDAVRGKVSPAELRAALVAWLAAKRAKIGSAPEESAPADGASSDHRTVRRAWRQFLGYLSLRRPETRTPGEIAQHAVDRDDLPGPPVRTLRDTYREVEYGARSAEDRLARVDEAVSAIEETVREREADEQGDDTDGQRVAADGGRT
jgi:transglutaminase-like putative cysteine protease